MDQAENIQPYLDYLMEDIRQSYTDRFKNTAQPSLTAGAVLRDVPEHLVEIPFLQMRPIYEWMRLNPEAFPPAGKLSRDQLRRLCNMIRHLFEAYNYDIQVPFELDFPEEYHWLVKALSISEANTLDEEGENGPDQVYPCERNHDTCPFGDYCRAPHCDFYNDGRVWLKYEE